MDDDCASGMVSSDDVEGGLVDYWLCGSIHDLIDIGTMSVLPLSWWSDDVEGGLVDYWLCGPLLLLLPFNGHRQLVDYSATFWVSALKLEHT